LDFDDTDDDLNDVLHWLAVTVLKDLVIVSEGRTKAPTSDHCDKQTNPTHKAITKHLDCVDSGTILFLVVVMEGLIVWCAL
jgi:hypothetical protein